MEDLFKQFSSFLGSAEGGTGGEGDDNEFKSAMEQAFQQILSKDNLYQPMKNLKDAYPPWLEKNWQGLS